MPRHADSRPKSRRSRSSSWLPGILLIAVVCTVSAYFAQRPEALERARNILGFGRSDPAPESSDNASADTDSPRDNPIEVVSFPHTDADSTADPASGFNSQDALAGNQPGTAGFLPPRRARNNSVPRSIATDHSHSETATADRLDDRFEGDAPALTINKPNPTRVQTAELVESEDGIEVRPVPSVKTVRDRRRRDSSALAKTEPNDQPFAPPQPRGQIEDENAAPAVRLTGGDDAEAPPAPRRPRPTVKANRTNANSGVKPLDMAEVQRLVNDGQDAEAYHKLSEAYFQFPSQRSTFQAQLDDVAQRIYFSPQTQIQPPYEIQAGDQLRKIANKYQLSWQYLSRLNQVDAKKIRAGRLLKVFQGPFEAKVDLSDFELTIMLNGQYVKRYLVGIGKTNSSPVGEFTVREKLENPTYYGPNGMVLDADDPANPLGERWIDIGNSFGIHGTVEPDSIGKSESAGCIRMRNEDVAEVYDLLVIGSQVRIQR